MWGLGLFRDPRVLIGAWFLVDSVKGSTEVLRDVQRRYPNNFEWTCLGSSFPTKAGEATEFNSSSEMHTRSCLGSFQAQQVLETLGEEATWAQILMSSSCNFWKRCAESGDGTGGADATQQKAGIRLQSPLEGA